MVYIRITFNSRIIKNVWVIVVKTNILNVYARFSKGNVVLLIYKLERPSWLLLLFIELVTVKKPYIFVIIIYHKLFLYLSYFVMSLQFCVHNINYTEPLHILLRLLLVLWEIQSDLSCCLSFKPILHYAFFSAVSFYLLTAHL